MGVPSEKLPDVYFSVVRVSVCDRGSCSMCSGTAVAILAGDNRDAGMCLITTAAHCFGAKARDGITVKFWADQFTSSTGTGTYYPANESGDFGLVVASIKPHRIAGVGRIGAFNDVRRKPCWTVGCPGGTWPPVFREGTITAPATLRGGRQAIQSSQPIAGGQSGGALFDSETGLLIGITNWGNFQGTLSLSPLEFHKGLDKWLP